MLAKIIHFVKEYQADIILVIGVILISLLSFAVGYIVAKQQGKEPIKILPYELRIQPNYEYGIKKVNGNNGKLFVIQENS